MYELIRAGENTYYINSPAKIGIYRCADNGVYLIDSGNDKDAGKKAKRILDARGWHLRAIVNTHANSDHTGGSAWLRANTGCGVFAKGIDVAIIRHSILEPAFLYGGYPCADLRHKFLMAQSCEAEDVSHPDFPRELEVFDLPGHFFHQIGVRTPDDVVFLADCLCSERTLQKYRVTYLFDIAAQLETLEQVERLEGKLFIPAHADAVEDVRPLCRKNREAILFVAQLLRELCAVPTTMEEVLRGVFDRCGLTMNAEQYVVVGNTVRCYLSWLRDRGELEISFADNRMLWQVKKG